MDQTSTPSGSIELSKYAEALLTNFKRTKPRPHPDELSRITVSQAVSLFAIGYEKIRNAIEYREDHLIRRAAIERILNRRFMLNPEGKNEAENLIRELLWARYFSNGSLGGKDIVDVQLIIDRYLFIKRKIAIGRPYETQQYLSDYILDLMTCEIEEVLSPETANRFSTSLFFIYQVLRKKKKLRGFQAIKKMLIFWQLLKNRSAKAIYHIRDIIYLSHFISQFTHIQKQSLKHLSQKRHLSSKKLMKRLIINMSTVLLDLHENSFLRSLFFLT